MSYLLDKKAKRNTFLLYTTFIVFLLLFIYFRVSIFHGLSSFSHLVFRPVFVLGNNVGEKLSNTAAYFYSKRALFLENGSLKSKLSEQEARVSNYNSILDENLKIKEILGRLPPARAGGVQAGKNNKANMILASILSKPNRSPYDVLVIDVGTEAGILSGQRVFALGNIPIGVVAEVYQNSSKVILFSNPGEKTEVVLSLQGAFVQIVGRGGGNFEMALPLDFILEKGMEAVLPGITPYMIATVQTIISDPRDSYQKALLISPVNIFELKFVEVKLD